MYIIKQESLKVIKIGIWQVINDGRCIVYTGVSRYNITMHYDATTSYNN